MTIQEKLLNVQSELKAPKGQYNSFGKYNYRNCEDILEAVKPLLKKAGLTLTINDEINLIGDRYYVKATATVNDGESAISTSAFAREANDKKGMDDSMLTGATSSYARKYCLNGLFLIDDNKDCDTDEYTKKTTTASTTKPAESKPIEKQPYKPTQQLPCTKKDEPSAPEEAHDKPKVIHVNGVTKLLKKEGYTSIGIIEKPLLRKMYDSRLYAEADAEIEKFLGIEKLSEADREILENV